MTTFFERLADAVAAPVTRLFTTGEQTHWISYFGAALVAAAYYYCSRRNRRRSLRGRGHANRGCRAMIHTSTFKWTGISVVVVQTGIGGPPDVRPSCTHPDARYFAIIALKSRLNQ